MKNSRVLLILLGFGLALSAYYAWQTMPGEERAGNQELSVSKNANVSDPSVVKRVDFSGGVQLEFRPPKKNLFGQLYPPPPVQKPPKIVAAPIVTPPPVAPVIPPPPPPPTVVRAAMNPMPNFQVLGFLEKADGITAFLSLQGKVYLAKKNQKIADDYQVADLDKHQITIGRISGVGEVKLPVAESTKGTVFSSGGNSRTAGRSSMRVVRPDPVELAPYIPPPMPEEPAPVEGGAPPTEIEPPLTDMVPSSPQNNAN